MLPHSGSRWWPAQLLLDIKSTHPQGVRTFCTGFAQNLLGAFVAQAAALFLLLQERDIRSFVKIQPMWTSLDCTNSYGLWCWLSLSFSPASICLHEQHRTATSKATRCVSPVDCRDPGPHHPFGPRISCQGLKTSCHMRVATCGLKCFAWSYIFNVHWSRTALYFPSSSLTSTTWEKVTIKLKKTSFLTKLCHFAPPPQFGGGAKWQSFVSFVTQGSVFWLCHLHPNGVILGDHILRGCVPPQTAQDAQVFSDPCTTSIHLCIQSPTATELHSATESTRPDADKRDIWSKPSCKADICCPSRQTKDWKSTIRFLKLCLCIVIHHQAGQRRRSLAPVQGLALGKITRTQQVKKPLRS